MTEQKKWNGRQCQQCGKFTNHFYVLEEDDGSVTRSCEACLTPAEREIFPSLREPELKEIDEMPVELLTEEALIAASDWADYRADYSKANDERELMIEHQAFLAGHKAALQGDQRGVLR